MEDQDEIYVMPLRLLKEQHPETHSFSYCAMCTWEKWRDLSGERISHDTTRSCPECKNCMYVIGLWPWLFWYCLRCQKKEEHEEQIRFRELRAASMPEPKVKVIKNNTRRDTKGRAGSILKRKRNPDGGERKTNSIHRDV
jgi:hypothetical protein